MKIKAMLSWSFFLAASAIGVDAKEFVRVGNISREDVSYIFGIESFGFGGATAIKILKMTEPTDCDFENDDEVCKTFYEYVVLYEGDAVDGLVRKSDIFRTKKAFERRFSGGFQDGNNFCLTYSEKTPKKRYEVEKGVEEKSVKVEGDWVFPVKTMCFKRSW